jgi:hypothetical protein
VAPTPGPGPCALAGTFSSTERAVPTTEITVIISRDGTSVADPDPGSGAFLPPGSGMNFFRIPDPAPFLMTFSYNIFRIHVMLSL